MSPASCSWVMLGPRWRRILGGSRNSGKADAWNPASDGMVSSIVPDGGIIYVGGLFKTIGGQAWNPPAALDGGSGVLIPWHPYAHSGASNPAVSTAGRYVG